jgi:CAAX prenyl protease-like protein
VGVFVLWLLLEPVAIDNRDGEVLELGLARLSRIEAAIWLTFRILGAVVTVPLAEELAFRGYLTRRLIAADFQDVRPGQVTWLSFLVSSALFGLLHGRLLAGMLAGMCYALALYRRGSLIDAVVAHATTNALLAVYVLATGSWSLWA